MTVTESVRGPRVKSEAAETDSPIKLEYRILGTRIEGSWCSVSQCSLFYFHKDNVSSKDYDKE